MNILHIYYNIRIDNYCYHQKKTKKKKENRNISFKWKLYVKSCGYIDVYLFNNKVQCQRRDCAEICSCKIETHHCFMCIENIKNYFIKASTEDAS